MIQANLIPIPDCDLTRDAWRTPPDLFAALNAEFEFRADVAADDENHLLPVYLTKRSSPDGALGVPWPCWWFCNPPFSEVGDFSAHAAAQASRGRFGVMLLPGNRREYRWWHNWVIGQASEVRDIIGRTAFVPPPGVEASSPAFGCCLAVYAHIPPALTVLRSWP